MKVFFIHHGGVAGGAPLSLLYTALGIKEYGYIPYVGLIKPSKALHELYNSNGIETLEVPFLPIFFTHACSEGKRYNPITWIIVIKALNAWKKSQKLIYKTIQENKFSIVHLNSGAISVVATKLNQEKFPFVWHIREHGPKHKGRRYKFLKNALLKTKEVIFLSEDDQKSWLNSTNHGTIIHNFIDFKKFDFRINGQLVKKNVGFSNPTLLFLGGLSAHKGAHILIKALSIVAHQFPSVRCLMLGAVINDKSSAHAQKSVRMISELGLEENCIRVPFDPDPVVYFAASDIVIFPATKPHFARPVIEAGAMKKSVIASDFKVMRTLVDNTKTGYLVKPNDVNDLADKIIYLLSNPELGKEMGNFGYEKAKKHFNQTIQVKKIAEIYDRLLNQ